MDDTTYRHHKKRVNDMVAFWKPILGLADWRINVTFYRDHAAFSDATGCDAMSTLMTCESEWEYKQGHIRVNMPEVEDSDDDDLENGVIHELLHCRICQMRDYKNTPVGRKHEERVVSDLTDALINAYNKGFRAGMTKAKKAHTA